MTQTPLPRAFRQPSIIHRLLHALRLSWADFCHEWRLSLCLILGLAAVLSPLLVLFGLKSGIIEGMRARLLSDPRTLEVVVIGNYTLPPEWFGVLQRDPLVSFSIPRTRSLSASLDLQSLPTDPDARKRSLSAVEMIPTAIGDPLLAWAGEALTAPRADNEVLLTHSAARDLAVSAGDQVSALVRRTLDGQQDVERHTMTVIGVVPEAVFGRDGVFVTLPFLTATEDFRDGRDGQDGRVAPPDPGQRSYASARIFAQSLDAVAPLADSLRAGGMEIRTKAAEIDTLQAMDRSLSVIFALIATLAAGGYLLSLTVSLWAHVDRKRKDLALLRLVGLSPLSIMAFPLWQGLLIALAGSALSVGLAFGVAAIINHTLAPALGDNTFICLLRWQDLLAASMTTVAVALAASSMGGSRAARIDPAESLREI